MVQLLMLTSAFGAGFLVFCKLQATGIMLPREDVTRRETSSRSTSTVGSVGRWEQI